jgi:hypothetical protein
MKGCLSTLIGSRRPLLAALLTLGLECIFRGLGWSLRLLFQDDFSLCMSFLAGRAKKEMQKSNKVKRSL